MKCLIIQPRPWDELVRPDLYAGIDTSKIRALVDEHWERANQGLASGQMVSFTVTPGGRIEMGVKNIPAQDLYLP